MSALEHVPGAAETRAVVQSQRLRPPPRAIWRIRRLEAKPEPCARPRRGEAHSMLHAAAMLLGLCILWLLATQRFGSPADVAAAVAAGALCAALAARAFGVSRAFARAPRTLFTVFSRAGAVLRGCLATMQAGLAADFGVKPALVRVRTRGRGPERAAFADMLSATPGMAVVETDPEGLLVHVMNEDAIDAADLGRLEGLTGARDDMGATL